MPEESRSVQEPDASTDGRVARRERNQAAVVDAYIELIRAGTSVPNPEELAEKANVSVRSIYRYFADRSSLLAEVADRVITESSPMIETDELGVGDLERRIDVFVESRLDLHERTGMLTLVGFRYHASDVAVIQASDRARAATRMEIAEHFAAELGALDPVERETRVVEIQIPFLIDALDYACRVFEQDRERVADMLRTHLRRILTDL